MINENNFSNIFNEMLKKNSVLNVFKLIKSQIDSLEEYNSLKDNYLSLFFYCCIDNKVDINDFNNFIIELYNYHEKEASKIFNRMFPNLFGRDEYEKKSFWGKVSNQIYNNKNNIYSLNDSAKPYLNSLFLNINNNLIDNLWDKGFILLLYNIIYDKKSILFLLDIGNKNLLYKKKQYNNFDGLEETFLKIIAKNSYEIKDKKEIEKIIKIFDLIKNNVKNFDDFLLKSLINIKQNKKEMSLDMLNLFSVLKFDFSMLMDNYIKSEQKKLKNEIFDKKFNDNEKINNFYINNHLTKNISDYSITINVALEKKDFILNKKIYKNININENNYLEYFVPIKMLELKCNQNKLNELDFVDINFLKNLQKIYIKEKNDIDSWQEFNQLFKYEKIKEKVEKLILEKELKNKLNKKQKIIKI